MNSTLACLAGWMAHQRWYSSKGTTPKLRLLARITVAPATPDARVEVLVVLDEGASPAVVYQVPLVRRLSATGTHPAHVIGRDEESVLIDGPFDPAYAGALLRDIASETHVHAAGTARRVAEVESRVLSGEQSNTSIIYASSGSRPVICKVFRQLNPGLNPDIELQSALAGAGCPYVPQSVGHIEASWIDPTDSTAHLSGSLAFAQEFLPDVGRVAGRPARGGRRRAVLAGGPCTRRRHGRRPPEPRAAVPDDARRRRGPRDSGRRMATTSCDRRRGGARARGAP